MKVRISRENFLKGIQTVYPIVPSRNTLPILSHILLNAEKETLHLAGTDLELGISTSVSAETEEEGAIAIPAKRLHDLIKELPDTDLVVTTKKNHQATFECERGFFKVMGLPKEEFPRLPQVGDEDLLVINQEVLQVMLALTGFAASKDESRYVLTGILFISEGSQLRLVATDGRRLAMVQREVMTPPKTNHQVIVPFKTINELHRLLGDEPMVKISLKENHIAFDLGKTQLISRLIEGKFPNYEQVIPQQSAQKLIVPREALLLAARRISLWATQDSPSIRFDLKTERLILSKQTPELGEAHEELQAGYDGPEFSIGFNPDYIIDVLKVLPDGTIEMELPGPEKPGVIRTKDQYVYIVLPMQLNT